MPKAGPKIPAIQFYTGDWMKDPNLSKCRPATRGIWIDAVCAMHDSDRAGRLSGTAEQLARVLRCSEPDLLAAVDDLKVTKTADVTVSHGKITLINRRMQREHRTRISDRKRQQKHRRNVFVTPPSSSSSSTSVLKPKPGSSFLDRVEAVG